MLGCLTALSIYWKGGIWNMGMVHYALIWNLVVVWVIEFTRPTIGRWVLLQRSPFFLKGPHCGGAHLNNCFVEFVPMGDFSLGSRLISLSHSWAANHNFDVETSIYMINILHPKKRKAPESRSLQGLQLPIIDLKMELSDQTSFFFLIPSLSIKQIFKDIVY